MANRSNPNNWGWIYYGFQGKMRPRVLCSCSGVHPKRGLEPIPLSQSQDDWPELCRDCWNQGISPVPFTELLSGENDLNDYMRDAWAKSGISGEIARGRRRAK